MAFLAKKLFSVAVAGCRTPLARSLQTSAPTCSGFKKWAFSAAGYNQYGLLADDLMNDMDDDVREAVRRLPQNLVDERNYRQIRAAQLSIQKSILPKDQWTKYEEDIGYLQPYLEEVIREREEREKWEATH